MRIVRVQPDAIRPGLLREAAAVLKRGGLVVYPTETAYALGCDATNAAALRRVYAVKKRDQHKPLPIIAASKAMAERYAHLDRRSVLLASVFWPGPLTLVLRAKAGLPKGVVSRAKETAVRVSGDVLARNLSATLGRPVVSTSANRSGGATPYRLVDILADVGLAPDLCLDAGELPRHLPSTIVRCLPSGACEVLRHGPVGVEAVLAVLNGKK